MEKLRWYFKNGTKFEEYTLLYDDGKFILVQNDNTEKYSYGTKDCFNSLCGFPIDQSCLSKEKAKEMLNSFIDIDVSYLDKVGKIAQQNIDRWYGMLKALTQIK